MTKFLIADDHALIRRDLMQILSEDFPGSLFGEVWNAHQIFEKVQEQKWDFVILTSSAEQKDVVEGYKLGANSYIQKSVDSKKFMESIKLLSLYWTLWNKLPIVAK